MKTMIRRALLAALAIAALALVSCAEGPTGIFASVAAETPVNKTMTPAIEYASPTFVARLGTTWYSGMGVLWQKAAGATQWTKASVSLAGVAASDTLFADSGAVVTGAPDKLYVAFSDVTTRTSLGVWAYDGTSWTAVDAAFPVATEYLRSIMVANDHLFAVTANVRTDTSVAQTYSIYYLNGAAFTSSGIGVTANATIGAPTSVAWDGTNYIFTAGDSLVSGTTENSLAVLSTTAGSAYAGVCSDGLGDIIISTRNGYLYRSTDSGVTLSAPAGPFKNSLGKIYSLSAPTYIAAAPDPILVVGTNRIPRSSSDIPPAGGYLEFDAANFATTFASSTPTDDHHLTASAVNFDTSLDSRSVSAMPYFAAQNKLFAMTDGYGLWSDTYSGTADHTNGWDWWIRE